MNECNYKKTADILSTQSSDLQFIIDKAKHLKALGVLVKKQLEKRLAAACEVANINQNTLVLIVHSGAIATQIKIESTTLLEQFQREPDLKHIHQIQCKVRIATADATPDEPHEAILPLSQKTGKYVRDIAAEMKDPALKAIFERIGSRVK